MGLLTYVLDASAVVRLLDGEAGGERVRAILELGRQGQCHILMSAVNWGEVVGATARLHGVHHAQSLRKRELLKSIQVVSATGRRSEGAALLKAAYKLPYADAFAVELAGDSPDHVLVTADFDFKAAEAFVRVEFLPTKARF